MASELILGLVGGGGIGAIIAGGIAAFRAPADVRKIKSETNKEDASAGTLISDAALKLLEPTLKQVDRLNIQLEKAEATIDRMGKTIQAYEKKYGPLEKV